MVPMLMNFSFLKLEKIYVWRIFLARFALVHLSREDLSLP